MTSQESATGPDNKDSDLNNVGDLFQDLEQPGADTSPAIVLDSGYGYGVLASVARLTDEVDDITQQTTRANLDEAAHTQSAGPTHDSISHPFYSRQQTPGPVYTSWQPRCTDSENTINPSLDDVPAQKIAVGSSLAPQSSSEGSTGEAPRPVVPQGKRPSYDRPILPAHHPARYQNLPRPQEESFHSIAQPPRVAHAPQPQPQIAPRPLQFAPQTTEDYGCSECGKVFNRKSDLVHHKRYHTRNFDRPYKCDECGQGFIHYKDLARHMPRHTGQRSFRCPFSDCDKNYTRKDNLNRHVRHDHAADPNAPMIEDNAPRLLTAPAPIEQKSEPEVDLSPDSVSASRHPSIGNARHEALAVQARELIPTAGKRSIDEVDSERANYAMKARRQPKEKWAHRLGCPFRKCKPEMFTSERGYRVCETTPHEFTIRLLEHLKRNHDIFVCGDCFLAFTSPEYLAQHKNTFVHCAECYVSFPDRLALAAHSQSCLPVDSSTQEHIWQIMYETICSDGVRHNPVFGEDAPVAQTIERNNLERMDKLCRQPSQQGQVVSLIERLRTSISSSSSGNGSAPPVTNSDQREYQRMGPAGAEPIQFGYRAYSGSETRQYRPQEFSRYQNNISSHPIASPHTGIAAVTGHPAFSSPASDEDSSNSMWHLESLVLSLSDVAVQSASPIRMVPRTMLKSPPLRSSFDEALAMAVRDYHCPTLTSESTTDSHEERFGITANIPYYPLMGSSHDPNVAIKTRTESFQYSWVSSISNNCNVCGAAIESDLTPCENCFGPLHSLE